MTILYFIKLDGFKEYIIKPLDNLQNLDFHFSNKKKF